MKKNYFFLAVLFFGYIGTFAQIPVSYYVNTHGKKMDELKTAFHQIISEPCDVLPYGWGAGCLATQFVKTDNYGDGRVWDMYSDVKLYYPNTYGVNIEHSLPKSWWGVSDETSDIYVGNVKAYQDLHHLSPSNVAANTAKGNYALGEVEGDIPYNDNGDILPFNNYVSKVGPGKSFMGYEENTVFEPDDEYKGDFARMYMYIVTCYQDYAWLSLGRNMFTDGIYPTLNKYSQDLLLKWHRQDPVSQKEVDRNNAIYSFQNNRNPFIDYPSLAEYIWGDSIAYAFHFSGSAVIAPILNVKNGDLVDFGNVSLGENKTLSVTIRGQYLTSDLSLKLEQSGTEFSLEDRVLSVDNLNSVSGAQLRISFHPDAFGSKEATLILYGNDFKDDIVLNVKALCMPAEVNPVSIDGLKASYGKNDAKVALRLRNSTENPIWYIDGKQITDGYLNPSGLSVGIHTIMFRTTSYSGKVRVNIN